MWAKWQICITETVDVQTRFCLDFVYHSDNNEKTNILELGVNEEVSVGTEKSHK